MSNFPIFDGHNDTLTHIFRPERGHGRTFFDRSEIGQIDLPRAQSGGLAGGIAHDFNNLLTAITGYNEFLLRTLSLDHPGRADAQEIARVTEQASSLTRQILAFSRRQVLQPQVIDLNEVIRGTDSLLRRLIGSSWKSLWHTATGNQVGSEVQPLPAAAAGAEAVLLVDPYYNGPSSLEIRREYVGPVAAAFPDLTVIPYVIPGRTGAQLLPEDLALLNQACDNVNTVKEATGNLDPDNKTKILDLLFKAVDEHETTLLAVTHDHELLHRFGRVINFSDFQAAGKG